MESLPNSTYSAAGVTKPLDVASLGGAIGKLSGNTGALNGGYSSMYDKYYKIEPDFWKQYGVDWGSAGGVPSTATSTWYQEICKYCNYQYQLPHSDYVAGKRHGCSDEKRYEHIRTYKPDRYYYDEYPVAPPPPQPLKSAPAAANTDAKVGPAWVIATPPKKEDTQHEKNLRKVYWNYKSRNHAT